MDDDYKSSREAIGFKLRHGVGILACDTNPNNVQHATIPAGSLCFCTANKSLYRKRYDNTWERLPETRNLYGVQGTDGPAIPVLMIDDPSVDGRMVSDAIQRYGFFEQRMQRDDLLNDAPHLSRHVMLFPGVIFGAQLSAASVNQNPRTVALLINDQVMGTIDLALQATAQTVARLDLDIEFHAGDVISARDISDTTGSAIEVTGDILTRWRAA